MRRIFSLCAFLLPLVLFFPCASAKADWMLAGSYDFSGAATIRGAKFNGFTQYGYDATYFKRNGSGMVVTATPGYPCYITMPTGSGTWAFEITTAPYNATGNPDLIYGLVCDHSPIHSGGGYQTSYLLLARNNGGFSLRKNSSTIAGAVNNGTFTHLQGHQYILRLERKPISGGVFLSGTWRDAAAPNTVLYSTTAKDTTEPLYPSQTMGFYCEGGAYVNVGWAVDSARVYQFIPDTDGPTIVSGVINASGRTGTLALTDATLPVLPPAGFAVTGFTLEARLNNDGIWTPVTTSNWVRDGNNRITFITEREILPAEQVRVVYDKNAGNVTDDADPAQPLESVTFVLANSSAFVATTTSKGIQVIGTRGHAVAKSDGYTVPAAMEFQSFWRSECPYGMAAGWKFTYAGFTDANNTSGYDADSIVIMGVSAWISNPGEPKYLITCTLSGQLTKTLAPGDLVEVDPVSIPVLPGGFVQIGTWYKTSGTRLAYQTWQYIGSGADGDGLRESNVDTVSAQTLLQPFPAYDAGRTYLSNAGQGPLMRNYRPLALVGQPHPLFSGTTAALLFIGDSINVQQDDWGQASHVTNDPYPARGWNGRFASANSIPYVVFGQGGSSYGGYTGAVNTALLQYFQGDGVDGSATIKRKVTHLLSEYGINTLRVQNSYSPNTAGGDALWAQRTEVAAIAVSHSLLFLQTTLTPMNTDPAAGWFQPDNESGTLGQAQADFVYSRGRFNIQVRNQSSTITGCVGFVDLAKAMEMDWQTNGNTRYGVHGMGDIHPDADGHQYMAEQAATDALPILIANPNPVPPVLQPKP